MSCFGKTSMPLAQWIISTVLLILAIEAIFSSSHSEPRGGWLAPDAVELFHEGRHQDRIWSNDNFKALIEALSGLHDQGLDPAHYHLAELKALRNRPHKRDRLATDAWFSAAAHMMYGKLDPLNLEPDWTAARREADLSGLLQQALDNGTVSESLAALAPRQPSYGKMVEELRRIRSQAESSHVVIPPGPALRPGMNDPRVAILQERLVQLGLLDRIQVTGVMDMDTDDALKSYQGRAGLEVDGIVGPQTLLALNRGVRGEIDQLRVNMERWRWLPDNLGQKHVRVNIADFSLSSWQDGELVRIYAAIVGKLYRETPVFSDRIRYLVFNPWWETPTKLARADKLPLFQQDPGAFERMGFQVLDRDGVIVDPATIDWNNLSRSNFPFRIRQMPGEMNALGQLKIMFPNKHDVYIHDTPGRGLFAQRQRAFSSGCIRVHDIFDLAQWLLADTPGWDRARVDGVVASGKETRVNLSRPIDVHILYFTAVIESYGGVRYLDDIYGRDSAVLNGLKARPVSD